MPQPIDVTSGHWWRFCRYEIHGRWIRPRPGAKLETYDPWADFWESRKPGGPQPPYHQLLELGRGLAFESSLGPGPLRRLRSASEKRVLDWCAAHGLLGLLPHQTVMAWLAPSWEPVPEKLSILVPTQIQYSRTGEGWATYAQPRFGPRYGYLANTPERCGTTVPEQQIPDDWPKPAALIQPLNMEACRHEDLAAAWSGFFPGVPSNDAETYRYPAPLSEAFWRNYAEPVEDFVAAVTKFGKALALLQSGNDTDEPSSARIREGMDILHALTRTVRPTVSPGNGGFRQEWLSTSLLGGLAMMAFLDLTEQRRILSCQACGAFVVTKAYQALYCSDRCRNTAQKRRHRAKKKESQAQVEKASGS